jgi:hypothetical protein
MGVTSGLWAVRPREVGGILEGDACKKIVVHKPASGRGDFNLLRGVEDKGNRHITNQHLVDTFNDWVEELELTEL